MTGRSARAYVFTSYKYLTFAHDYNKNPSDKVKYMIAQVEECPTTKRCHVQGYVELKEPMTILQVKKILHDDAMHLEKRKGEPHEVRRCFCYPCCTAYKWISTTAAAWEQFYLPAGPGLLPEGGESVFWGWSVGADGVGRMERC